MQATFAQLAAGPVTTITCGCKINLGLRITGRRNDGYHLLDSLFVPLREPCDHMRLAPSKRPGLTQLLDVPDIDPENSTLARAYRVFARATGLAPRLVAQLQKGIPWGAGLGGGSSDAAALLRHLARLAGAAGTTVSRDELLTMATRVGADVPFFLHDGPMSVAGIGERLAPVDLDLSAFTLVLVTPEVRVSTPWAYQAYDESLPCGCLPEKETGPAGGQGAHGQSCAQALTALAKAYKERLPVDSPVRLVNDLEPVVFKRYPVLGRIKEELLRAGACAASMSGSGSSVFGLFLERNRALAAAGTLAWPARTTSLAGM